VTQTVDRVLLVLVVALAMTGCAISGGAPQAQREAVPAGLIGPVIAAPDGGPPIECRGLPQERCREVGALGDGQGGIESRGIAKGDIERVIVSCEGTPCTHTDGAFRIDILMRDGATTEIGRGGYGAAVQP
jgi:hypothetical protein